jgi:hypothetical protein
MDERGVGKPFGVDLAHPEDGPALIIGNRRVRRPLELISDVVDTHGLDPGQAIEVDREHAVIAARELLTHITRDTGGDFVSGEEWLAGQYIVAVGDDEI